MQIFVYCVVIRALIYINFILKFPWSKLIICHQILQPLSYARVITSQSQSRLQISSLKYIRKAALERCETFVFVAISLGASHKISFPKWDCFTKFNLLECKFSRNSRRRAGTSQACRVISSDTARVSNVTFIPGGHLHYSYLVDNVISLKVK